MKLKRHQQLDNVYHVLSSEYASAEKPKTVNVSGIPMQVQGDVTNCGFYVLEYIERFVEEPDEFMKNSIEPWMVDIDKRRQQLLEDISTRTPLNKEQLPKANSIQKKIETQQPGVIVTETRMETTQIISDNDQSQRPKKLHKSWPQEIAAFLETKSGPILHLAQVFKEIMNMDAVKTLQRAENPRCDLTVPLLLPTGHCWSSIPSWKDFFSTLINAKGWQIFRRGAPYYELGEGHISDVIEQWFNPNEANCYYATGIIIPSEKVDMVLPESIMMEYGPQKKDSLHNTANIMPKSANTGIKFGTYSFNNELVQFTYLCLRTL